MNEFVRTIGYPEGPFRRRSGDLTDIEDYRSLPSLIDQDLQQVSAGLTVIPSTDVRKDEVVSGMVQILPSLITGDRLVDACSRAFK